MKKPHIENGTLICIDPATGEVWIDNETKATPESPLPKIEKKEGQAHLQMQSRCNRKTASWSSAYDVASAICWTAGFRPVDDTSEYSSDNIYIFSAAKTKER